MQGRCSDDSVKLDLPDPTTGPSAGTHSTATTLSIDQPETAEARIRRMIDESPVIIFSRASCCMCHGMRNLLTAVGAHPTVIELDDIEIEELHNFQSDGGKDGHVTVPTVFMGGSCVGGFESLVALHLSGNLVPRLVQVGALLI